jgi:hypothetical protein
MLFARCVRRRRQLLDGHGCPGTVQRTGPCGPATVAHWSSPVREVRRNSASRPLGGSSVPRPHSGWSRRRHNAHRSWAREGAGACLHNRRIRAGIPARHGHVRKRRRRSGSDRDRFRHFRYRPAVCTASGAHPRNRQRRRSARLRRGEYTRENQQRLRGYCVMPFTSART